MLLDFVFQKAGQETGAGEFLQLGVYHIEYQAPTRDIRLQNQVQATCQDVSWKPIVPALREDFKFMKNNFKK